MGVAISLKRQTFRLQMWQPPSVGLLFSFLPLRRLMTQHSKRIRLYRWLWAVIWRAESLINPVAHPYQHAELDVVRELGIREPHTAGYHALFTFKLYSLLRLLLCFIFSSLLRGGPYSTTTQRTGSSLLQLYHEVVIRENVLINCRLVQRLLSTGPTVLIVARPRTALCCATLYASARTNDNCRQWVSRVLN